MTLSVSLSTTRSLMNPPWGDWLCCHIHIQHLHLQLFYPHLWQCHEWVCRNINKFNLTNNITDPVPPTPFLDRDHKNSGQPIVANAVVVIGDLWRSIKRVFCKVTSKKARNCGLMLVNRDCKEPKTGGQPVLWTDDDGHSTTSAAVHCLLLHQLSGRYCNTLLRQKWQQQQQKLCTSKPIYNHFVSMYPPPPVILPPCAQRN